MTKLAYTFGQAMELTGIGEHELRRAITEGQLPVIRIGSRGRIIIPAERLEEWLRARSEADSQSVARSATAR